MAGSVGKGLLFQVIFGCWFFLSSITPALPAEDPSKAKLVVAMSNAQTKGYNEFYIKNDLVLKVSGGQDKEVTFTPDPSGTSVIRFVSYNFFGFKFEDRDYEFKVGPGGVIRFQDVGTDCTFKVIKSGVDISQLTIELDEAAREREIANEIVKTPPGAKRTVKRTRTIERTVTLIDSDSVEKSAAAKVIVVSSEIRSKIERSRSTTYKESETVEQAIEIDGKELPKAKLKWIERSVTGTITTVIDGKKVVLPFRFPETLELQAEPID